MRIISVEELKQSPQTYKEMADILREDGIVCVPASNNYRLIANFLSEDAVIKFLQIKRRTNKAPVLLFIPSAEMLSQVVEHVPVSIEGLLRRFWPGHLTLLFDIKHELPRKIRRNLNVSQIGVRVPDCSVASELVKEFGGPVLVSSANISKKSGASSEAQIRKNFGRWIEVLVSAGDLKNDKPSTIVDATQIPPKLKREGLVEFETIMEAWNQDNSAAEPNPIEEVSLTP